MNDKYFYRLCNELRDAAGEENIRRAAQALRRYLRDQQCIIRQRLSPYVERAFMASLHGDQHQSN